VRPELEAPPPALLLGFAKFCWYQLLAHIAYLLAHIAYRRILSAVKIHEG
jgi:hypothetical protein